MKPAEALVPAEIAAPETPQPGVPQEQHELTETELAGVSGGPAFNFQTL